MVHCAKRCIHEQFIHEQVCIVSNCYPQTAMGQVTSRCERRRSIRLPPIATEESYGSSVCSSILDSNRFEQSLSYVLTEHGLRVTSNIFYDESMNILDNTTALHDARIFILQVHQQGLKHSPSVRQKWQVHKDGLKLAGLRAYRNAVDKWFDAIDAGGKRGPPPALGKDAHVLYEVDMMSQPGPERPAQVELPQVAARLEGYAELTTLQKIIREKLQTPALIEVTLGADLSERKQRQIGKQRELAKHLGCTSVLFYNGMQDANIDIHEETISVWISRENVEHFALRKAQKEAEMALQQRQGWVDEATTSLVFKRKSAVKFCSTTLRQLGCVPKSIVPDANPVVLRLL